MKEIHSTKYNIYEFIFDIYIYMKELSMYKHI